MKSNSLPSTIISLTIISVVLAMCICYVGEFIARAQGVDEYRTGVLGIIFGIYMTTLVLVARSYAEMGFQKTTRLNLTALFTVIIYIIHVIVGTLWTNLRFPEPFNSWATLIPVWSIFLGACAGTYFISQHQLKGMNKTEVFK